MLQQPNRAVGFSLAFVELSARNSHEVCPMLSEVVLVALAVTDWWGAFDLIDCHFRHKHARAFSA